MTAGRRRLPGLAHRAIALLALTGFLAGSLGVPVLVPPGGIDLGPYPCRGHRCGCTTAAQCWFSCCCLTHQEKLRWAHQHGIEPPPGVVALARKEAELARKAKQRSGGCACCLPRGTEPSTCNVAGGVNACGMPHGATPIARRPSAQNWSLLWVCAISARRCHGQAQQWMALGSVTPPPPHFQVPVEWQIRPLFTAAVASLCGVSFAPQPPPPRA